MNLQGYCILKQDADLSKCMDPSPERWLKNRPIRVMEFNKKTNSVLLIDHSASQMGMIEWDDMAMHFECEQQGEVLIPSGLNEMEKMVQVSRRLTRKGGYSKWVRSLVVAASFHRQEFNDDFLFQKQ